MKDKRYSTINKLLAAKGITTFNEIFDIIPPSVVSTDLHLNYYSLQNRMKDHTLFNLSELLKLAKLIGCNVQILIDLALRTGK